MNNFELEINRAVEIWCRNARTDNLSNIYLYSGLVEFIRALSWFQSFAEVAFDPASLLLKSEDFILGTLRGEFERIGPLRSFPSESLRLMAMIFLRLCAERSRLFEILFPVLVDVISWTATTDSFDSLHSSRLIFWLEQVQSGFFRAYMCGKFL